MEPGPTLTWGAGHPDGSLHAVYPWPLLVFYCVVFLFCIYSSLHILNISLHLFLFVAKNLLACLFTLYYDAALVQMFFMSMS